MCKRKNNILLYIFKTKTQFIFYSNPKQQSFDLCIQNSMFVFLMDTQKRVTLKCNSCHPTASCVSAIRVQLSLRRQSSFVIFAVPFHACIFSVFQLVRFSTIAWAPTRQYNSAD